MREKTAKLLRQIKGWIGRAMARATGTDPGTGELHVVCIVKGVERYVWLYTDGQEGAVQASIWRMAADPELSLTKVDAAGAARCVRRGE